MSVQVAIIGLGTVGSRFLKEILEHQRQGIQVMCVSELEETEGKTYARSQGIAISGVDEILARGNEVDVIFDLTGSRGVRRMLREGLAGSDNQHTVVVPETVSHLVWGLMTRESLPAPSDHSRGY